MEYSTYNVIREILMGLIFFLGGHMLFSSLPQSISDSYLKKSIRMMGVAFLIVPISCLIYTKSNQLDLKNHLATAINLTAYYPTFILMGISCLILLGKRFGKLLTITTGVNLIIFSIPLWICIIIGDTHLIEIAITASYSFFVIMIILLAVFILYYHRQLIKNVDNFYSDEMHLSTKWITKSIIPLLGLAFVCAFAPAFYIFPRWLRFIAMIYGILCYLHIFYGYQHLIINLAVFMASNNNNANFYAVIAQKKEADTNINADVTQNIKIRLEEWLARKEYHKKGININDVSREINTNRTYLSKYINTIYKHSFRSWITQLRLEDAKILLAESSDITIHDIATSLGFSSLESFTHLFTRSEGVSPSKWRERHTNLNIT